MAGRFSFELKTSGTTLLLLSFVIATGFFTYRNLKEITDEVSKAAKPDIKIGLLKQITSDLSDAESSVKSYNLTGDKNYLTPFYGAITSIDDKIEQLQSGSAYDSEQKLLVDSVEILIEEKYSILNELLSLRQDESIIEDLERISLQLDESNRMDEASIEGIISDENVQDKETEKPGIFKRIFGKQKTRDSVDNRNSTKKASVHESKNIVGINNVKSIHDEIAKVKTKQATQIQETRRRELELTRNDKEVMDKIRALISRMENLEQAAIALQTLNAAKRAKETRLIIGIFCVVASIFLLAVCLALIGYVRKRRLYEAALKDAKTEAENHAKAKELFLANMSHEIRTPMNAIAGFSDLLMHSGLNSMQLEQADIVKKSSDHLLRVINDILDYSKMQAGKMEFDKTGFKPIQIINDTFQLISQAAKAKNIELLHDIGKNVPEIVIGDPVRLRQVLLNLVNNSVKFTDRGFVKIELNGRFIDPKIVRLYFKVTDTGIGIPEDKMNVIFNEFEQAGINVSHKYGGTGLGLSITKVLIELQGGDIYINSAINKGTEVSFNLPFVRGAISDVEQPTEGITENIDMHEKTALIVDDEKFNRKLLASILKKWQVQLTEAENGLEALQKVNETNFDILLIDIRMPEMDGIELTREIRKLNDPEKASVPIIAISAATALEDISNYRSSGINEIISKPFKEEELYQKVRKILGGRKDKNNTTA